MDSLRQIRDAGIVGAGGAGFPSYAKLNCSVEYFIVNGAECEPLLGVDQQLAAYYPEKLIDGIKIAISLVSAKKGIIALKAKYKKAIEILEKLTKKIPEIEIAKLKNFYPAGDEHLTVYECIKRVVPEGGIPLHVSAVVNNVGTVINISDALQTGQPVIKKYVTVHGEVDNPGTYLVPIGINILDLLNFAGARLSNDVSVINGGPMMGALVSDLNTPVTKTCSGLLVLPNRNPVIREKKASVETILKVGRTACCSCYACTELCSRFLMGHSIEPDKVMRSISYGKLFDPEVIKSVFACSECGICSLFACPMDLSPRRVNSFYKKELKLKGFSPENKIENEFKIHPAKYLRHIPVPRLISRLGLNKYIDIFPGISEKEIEVNEVCILFSQHIGKPCSPIVNEGDSVFAGQKIGDVGENDMGVPIHSSIDGRVSKITEKGIYISRNS